MKSFNDTLSDLDNMLKNNELGYSIRKVTVFGIGATMTIANLAYIINCYIHDRFDGTFIAWEAGMVGFISATFVALYAGKNRINKDVNKDHELK